ncbi:MAG: hypothetical protein RRE78_10120 [Acidianus sp.]|nr:hypothetical protein [Acidianus sp.]
MRNSKETLTRNKRTGTVLSSPFFDNVFPATIFTALTFSLYPVKSGKVTTSISSFPTS